MTLARTLQAALVVLATLTCGTAASQELLDTQMELNGQALDAATDGDYETAVRLLRSSLELGELNVTWLNLGRVHQLAGACQESREAYDRVPSAQAVVEPPRDVVLSARERYMRELDSRCAGTLVVRCDPPTMAIDVDGLRLRCDQPTSLVAGAWRVGGRLGSATGEKQVVIRPGQKVEVELSLRQPAAGADPEPPPISGWFVAGWATAGVALVSGIAAGVVFADVSETVDELEVISATPGGDRARYDQLAARVDGGRTVFYLMLGVSSAAAVSSGVFFYLGWTEPVEVAITPTGAVFTTRF